MQFTISNILTITRLIVVPLFLFCFFSGRVGWEIVATILFIGGALTDHYDGKLARKRKEVTEFGRFTDPLADKFLTLGAFIAIVAREDFGRLFVYVLAYIIIIAIREIGLTIMRLWAVSRKTPVITSIWGKLKTTFQLIAIIFALVYFNFRDLLLQMGVNTGFLNDDIFKPLIHHLILLSMLATVISGLLYLSHSSFETRRR